MCSVPVSADGEHGAIAVAIRREWRGACVLLLVCVLVIVFVPRRSSFPKAFVHPFGKLLIDHLDAQVAHTAFFIGGIIRCDLLNVQTMQ